MVSNSFLDARTPVHKSVGHNTPFIRTIFTLDSCSPISGMEVQSFKDEKDMLMAWQKFFVEVDPDIVIGYNITQFDIHYVLERALTLKLSNFPYLGRVKCMLLLFYHWSVIKFFFQHGHNTTTFPKVVQTSLPAQVMKVV